MSFCITQHTLRHISHFKSIWEMSHFIIHSKLQHTIHYLYWDPPAPYLALYCIAHWKNKKTKQNKKTEKKKVILKIQLSLSKSDFLFESTLQKEHNIVKFLLSLKMLNFLFLSTFQNTFITYIWFCSFHFAIYSKLQHTFHYLNWNCGTPTPCLPLYSITHWKKQTYVIFNF